MPVRPAILALLTNFLIPDCTALRRLKIVMPIACKVHLKKDTQIHVLLQSRNGPGLLGVTLGFAVSETDTTLLNFIFKKSAGHL